MDKYTREIIIDMLLALQLIAGRTRGKDRAELETIIQSIYEKLRRNL